MKTDKHLLRRVLENMTKNALEATSPGADIALGCCGRNGRVRFSVHQPGVIPEDVQLQIFQHSFTTKGKGRGLGTYTIKLLTERYLGGTVWFVSSEKAGTTFFAEYPLLLNPEPAS
jgi:signal transduction histidine kinase